VENVEDVEGRRKSTWACDRCNIAKQKEGNKKPN
jgi:hypothetical protein